MKITHLKALKTSHPTPHIFLRKSDSIGRWTYTLWSFFMGFVDIKRSFKFDKTTYIGQISLCLHVNFYISDIELLITAVSEAT